MKTILAIDDEPAILECFQEAFGRKGYTILITTNPADGLNTLKEKEIDLVLLDIMMPEKDGFDVYGELRKHRKIPVLFVTAYPKSFTKESDRVAKLWMDEFSEGTTDIIYKPFTLDDLFAKVEGLIGQAQDTEATE